MKKCYKSLVFVVSLFVFTLISSLFFVSYADDVIGKSKVDFWNSDTNSVASAELDVFQNEKYVYAVLPDQSIAIVYFLGNDKEVNIAADFPNQTVTAICTQAFNAFCGEYKTTEPINGHEIIQGMNFTSIVIPDTVTYIGKWNFVQAGNRYITDIHFPSSLKHLGYGTPQNTKFEVIPYIPSDALAENYYFVGNNSKKLQLEEGYIVIPSMFCDNHNATTVVIPSGVKVIKEGAFAGLHNAEITIPESVEEIEKGSFVGSNNLNNTYIVVAGSYAEQWATDKGYKKKIIIPVKSIELDNSSLLLNKGKSSSLKAVLSPADASTKKVEWISSDSAIATVNNGTVKGIACGECDIICKSTDGSGVQAVCHVSVIQMVQNIQAKEKKVTIPFGESYKPEITIKPDDATDKSLSWSSSNPNVCSVNETGEIYANGAGVCDITGLANDGSGKNVKIQVSVPIFSTPEFSYTISEKGETCIPIDLNKADISIINHKPSNQNILLYNLDEQGLHVYPIKEGSTSITLSNKNDPKDKSIISLAIEDSAVFTDSDPLQAFITLEKAKVDAGESIKASYAICGGKAPYTIIECYGRCQMPNGSINGTPHREAKNAAGNVSLKVLPGSVEAWLELSVKDADGNVIKAESNHAKVKALQVSYDCSYVIAARNEPMEITFSVTGGSGNYTAEIQWDIFGNNGEDGIRNIHKETKKINDKGVFSYTPLSGYGVECFITIKDSKNPNLLIRNSNPRGAVLADDWSLKITYDQPIATQGEPFYADLHFVGKSPDILETCYWRFRSEDGTNGETIEINSSDYIKKEDNVLSVSYTPSSKGTLYLYLTLAGYDNTFITRSITVE